MLVARPIVTDMRRIVSTIYLYGLKPRDEDSRYAPDGREIVVEEGRGGTVELGREVAAWSGCDGDAVRGAR